MAIIRNDRTRNDEREEVEEVEPEEEIDYSWHPNEDEYVSPLTSEQWAELLRDESFAQSDAGNAVRCLREYGEPATFQQLSIRYRGTMGRYRRWLAEAAQIAGKRFGVPAPQKDQFGMDEWWPLLYQVRNAGKPGAGIFEMLLRSEVEDAFLKLEEEERQAKRAENVRQLKRIEQLERAKQEERRRATGPLAADVPTKESKVDPVPAASRTDAPTSQGDASAGRPNAGDTADRAVPANDGAVSVPIRRFKSSENAIVVSQERDGEEDEAVPLPLTLEFLSLMSKEEPARGMRFVSGGAAEGTDVIDLGSPIDYSLRYAERLRHVLSLMRKGRPSITLAAMARTLGDESVEALQSVVNGQSIPSFAYLESLRSCLFVNVERLEAPDGMEEGLPAFVTLDELWAPQDLVRMLVEQTPTEIAYVVDDSDQRRTGVVVRFSDTRCSLLTRHAINGAAHRSESSELEAFIRMVDELDTHARAHKIVRTSRQVTSGEWDLLATGKVWPGAQMG